MLQAYDLHLLILESSFLLVTQARGIQRCGEGCGRWAIRLSSTSLCPPSITQEGDSRIHSLSSSSHHQAMISLIVVAGSRESYERWQEDDFLSQAHMPPLNDYSHARRFTVNFSYLVWQVNMTLDTTQ